jgi:hypothetical protein
MADFVSKFFIYNVLTKQIDCDNDEFKLMLCEGSYSNTTLGNISAYSDLSAYEIDSVSGTSYDTAGGILCAGTSANIIDNNVYFNCDSVYVSASSADINDIRFAAIYHVDTGCPVYYWDFTEEKDILTGSVLAINTDSNGFIKVYNL